ncbi:MAG: hypothetical protein WBG58_05960 [Ignavibacteriaceae bacterium]
MKSARLLKMVVIFLIMLLITSGFCQDSTNKIYTGITIAPSYSYHMTGRTDRITGFVVNVDEPNISNPGLIFLASGIETNGDAYLTVNNKRYEIPPLEGEFKNKIDVELEAKGKAQFYSVNSADDIVGKYIIPIDGKILKEGINEIAYFKKDGTDGFEIIGTIIQSVDEKEPKLVGQTYHILSRGRPASISDFDYIFNYKGEKVLNENDIPDWGRRGKVNFYRTGIDWDNLDRLFEMFEEARINLCTVHVPSERNSEEYYKVKSFIERCHKNNIRVTAFNSLGGIRLRNIMLNPELEKWISQDEYGNKRWRMENEIFAADLANENYRNSVLEEVKIQIELKIDEIYFDYAIGGTGDVLDFLYDVRNIAKNANQEITIYGNCKGNILVDEVCDLTKSEGTTEAGVWNGKWLHNIPQARFYYAVGNQIKPYRSKYEGSDPGVPNPGAYDVRDSMKYGWQKPIAEASAFQSHFAIAESGGKMFNHWIKKDNDLAMEIWNSIVQYYTFLDDYQDLFTEVFTVSNIGVVAPPLVPSFEVSLKRDNLYNTLAEMNVMYEVILLHNLNVIEMLNKYRTLIFPNIPWVNKDVIELIKQFKEKGGKIITIGSSEELRNLADIQMPTSIFNQLDEIDGRKNLVDKINEVTGSKIISIQAASEYIAGNIVRKRGTNRYFLHFVNYNESLKNVTVNVDLTNIVNGIIENSLKLFTPDNINTELKNVKYDNNKLSFTMPELNIYNVVEFDVK